MNTTPADGNAHLYHWTDARGNDWFEIIGRAGETVLPATRDEDAANQAALDYPEIIGCEERS